MPISAPTKMLISLMLPILASGFLAFGCDSLDPIDYSDRMDGDFGGDSSAPDGDFIWPDGDDGPDGDNAPDGDDISDGDDTPDGDEEPFVTDRHGLTWALIPAGSFIMGCTPDDGDCANDLTPVRAVEMKRFRITTTEVTNAQYVSFLNSNGIKCNEQDCLDYTLLGKGQLKRSGDQFSVSDADKDRPVNLVTWYGAKVYCEWAQGRLPSEAEWEYAAKGGTITKYPCGTDMACLDQIAWHADNAIATQPVGQKDPNAYGLYDMLGNLREWVNDNAHHQYLDAPADGRTWTEGDATHRAVRGGHYMLRNTLIKVSLRQWHPPYLIGDLSESPYLGFRCAKDVDGGYPDGDEPDGDSIDGDSTDGDTIEVGTWTDSTTGLTWQNPPAAEGMRLANARTYCSHLGAGWRLPIIDELRSLVRGCASTQADGPCTVNDECILDYCDYKDCTGCSDTSGPASGCYWPNELEGYCNWYWSESKDHLSYPIIASFAGPIAAMSENPYLQVRCVSGP